MAQCRALKADGTPCLAPEALVDPETGLCPSHAPGSSERLSEQGKRGAEATARRLRGEGLDADELPPLDSHANAKRWLEIIGRAVTSRRLIHNEARVAIQAVSEWVKTEGEHKTSMVLDELRAEVERLKRELSGGRKNLRAVK